MSDTTAPSSETPVSTHSAMCMFAMNGSSCFVDSPEVTPEKILNSTVVGTAEVTTAITNAIEMTAPVFCSIIRAPAAMPRRCTGRAHHRRRVRAVEHARADADEEKPERAPDVRRVRLQHRHSGEADCGDEHAERGEPA